MRDQLIKLLENGIVAAQQNSEESLICLCESIEATLRFFREDCQEVARFEEQLTDNAQEWEQPEIEGFNN